MELRFNFHFKAKVTSIQMFFEQKGLKRALEALSKILYNQKGS